ncbi:MAG: VWA domain-containing protein [Verrucomicrobia bacterium]|nr:VWA domain-containing protein [Verrucomicrobiota bacterium]MDA1006225.1 VWA domain-containing protein [Verrucomicrobiota bacterium]
MNKDLTEIAYILDRSGSMNAMTEPAIAGFNHFLKDQAEAPGKARLTLVLFDDEYLVPHRSLPIGQVPPLDTTTYVPRSMTALFDAIGRTIEDLGKQLAALPEEERPGQVIVAIFTDGLENASTDYDLKKISKMIKHQQDAYKWSFLFLAANQDAIATAAQMGIARTNSSTVQFSQKGVTSSSASFSRKMKAMRLHSSTGEQSADYAAPMEEIVKEEEDKPELN